jgi:membrane protein implicated in regulation of membrane protease activity
MFARPKDVPIINHPVFRIVLGAVLIAVGLLVSHHHQIIITAIGALLLILGLVRGVSVRTGRTAKEQRR